VVNSSGVFVLIPRRRGRINLIFAKKNLTHYNEGNMFHHVAQKGYRRSPSAPCRDKDTTTDNEINNLYYDKYVRYPSQFFDRRDTGICRHCECDRLKSE